jgi:hypothetical protein
LAEFQQRREIERLVEAVVLLDGAEAADFRPDVGLVENIAEIEALGLPVVDRLAGR